MWIWILSVGWLVVINGAAVFVVRRDKRNAAAGRWRTPERTFRLLALLGGGFGVLVAFQLFRHKTKHRALQASVLVLAVLNAVALGVLIGTILSAGS